MHSQHTKMTDHVQMRLIISYVTHSTAHTDTNSITISSISISLSINEVEIDVNMDGLGSRLARAGVVVVVGVVGVVVGTVVDVSACICTSCVLAIGHGWNTVRVIMLLLLVNTSEL